MGIHLTICCSTLENGRGAAAVFWVYGYFGCILLLAPPIYPVTTNKPHMYSWCLR